MNKEWWVVDPCVSDDPAYLIAGGWIFSAPTPGKAKAMYVRRFGGQYLSLRVKRI